MDTFHLRVFQQQVLDQCQFLIWGAVHVNEGLKANNTDRILFGIQNVLNAGANISKMLWGQGGKHTKARQRLRDSIGIGDASPLREVTMRNHFEHIDERIDRWWAESPHKNHADKVVGPRNLIGGLDPIDTFRFFDPTTAEVIFWGQAFDLRALVAEVERIVPGLRVEVAKPHWDEPMP